MDADVIVIGCGAVGASVAKHLAEGGCDVLVLEKEGAPAKHQSGRSSGVIHAGYNLKPGSQKARYCVEGSRALRDYCLDRGVAVEQGGILIVANTVGEEATLRELDHRARENGVRRRLMDGVELREVEPHAHGSMALHAPEGASLDAVGYVGRLVEDARRAGASFRFGTRVRSWQEGDAVRVHTDGGDLRARVLVNAAGLHADRMAADLAPDMRVIPFRGYYAELKPPRRHLVRSHIYAAPDLRFPFLGVHLSRRFDGRVIVGPGAMLAFGREAYRFLGINPRDLVSTLGWGGFWRMAVRPEFRRLIVREVAKSVRLRSIWLEARSLVPELRPRDLVRSYAGNRAQMVDGDGNLVEDVVVRETDCGVHVLNAVSPGLTCSLPFGRDVAKMAAGKL